jgi:hypothetical protein
LSLILTVVGRIPRFGRRGIAAQQGIPCRLLAQTVNPAEERAVERQ